MEHTPSDRHVRIVLPSRPSHDTGIIKAISFNDSQTHSYYQQMYTFKLVATVLAFFAIQASAALTPVPCKTKSHFHMNLGLIIFQGGDTYCEPSQQCCKGINGPV
jgi:hypothetical protein